MKTLAIIIAMMTLFSLNSMGQSNNVNKILQDPESRGEVINTILNNNQMMNEFIQQMNENQQAMTMCRGRIAL